MNEVKAARLLTIWKRDSRSTVSVTKKEYDDLLQKVPRLFASVDPEGKVIYVTLRKEQAVSFLKAEYNLHETPTSCQNVPTSKS